MRYRPDIDGLRALIVVVLFHAGAKSVPGGFVGVDIFFVISGFLITGLITDRLREGDFSFWEFYARRTAPDASFPPYLR
jgi:peptidoglycan/LPS O-acetylase OafA/YrhL